MRQTKATTSGFSVLPEDCVAKILSFLSPLDVCRSSAVSRLFSSAATSDAVWGRFLPAEHRDAVIRSFHFSSKKQLFLSLCDHPLLINDGKKSFSLEKQSGKKCIMLSARDLVITCSNDPRYWKWIALPCSRFREAAELVGVCWLDIHGKINSQTLSENTLYQAYLVFKLAEDAYGFEHMIEAKAGLVGSECCRRRICLNEKGSGKRVGNFVRWSKVSSSVRDTCYPVRRSDGWLEVEIGEFLIVDGDREETEIGIEESKQLNWKRGLIVHGIEIRPRSSDQPSDGYIRKKYVTFHD